MILPGCRIFLCPIFMSNKKNILILLFISLISVGFYFYYLKINPPIHPTLKETETTYQKIQKTYIELKNDYEDEISVYDFMTHLKNEEKITFTDKTYTGMWKFIDSINDIQGNGAQNWIYYVNGKKAEVGVSNYKINKGDIVSWRYEKGF